MASVYVRNSKIYISWYDSSKQKKCSKSTGLINNPDNFKYAQTMAEKIQSKLDINSEKMSVLKIKRITIDTAFQHFLKNNISKHPKTISDYNRFYRKFTERFSSDKPATVITKLSVEDWIYQIKLLPFAKNTIFGYFKQLNHFLNFLFEYNYVPMFKINKDIKPKREIKEKIVFNNEDIKKIFSKLDDKSLSKTNQFKTLVYLAFYTGLRSSDLMTITVDRIDIDRQEINYYSPKRKLYRKVAFHPDLIPILQKRIDEIKEGKVIDYKATEIIGRVLRRYFVQIGINDKGYSARTFRKTFITLCRSYGMDASIVAELVGHEHNSTADKFYNRIDHNLMLEELRKFHRPL